MGPRPLQPLELAQVLRDQQPLSVEGAAVEPQIIGPDRRIGPAQGCPLLTVEGARHRWPVHHHSSITTLAFQAGILLDG
ncbi:MAG: hypothetical protein NTZ40_00860 [Cyanobacteria bacterium]|nr:hypothetical protein [Cyanobacteriota bacterium]